MKELTKKEARVIRKLLRKGVEVPQICKDFQIPPENWRDVSIKYDLFK